MKERKRIDQLAQHWLNMARVVDDAEMAKDWPKADHYKGELWCVHHSLECALAIVRTHGLDYEIVEPDDQT